MCRRKRRIKKIGFLVFLFCFGFCASLIYEGYGMYQTAVEQMPIEQKVEMIRSREHYTCLDNLPEIYREAVVSVEDHRFYIHFGIDPIAIIRAAVNNIKEAELVEGGSGITQQLSKNLYFTQEKKFTRKIAEAFMALDFERRYTKDEILELYVNSIFFGEQYYCVGEASLGYFGKLPQNMSDYESTLLAGIPNAPSLYVPTQNPELAHQRQLQVLSTMVDHGFLTEEEAQSITE